jgi:hypothetical protein
MQQYHSHVHGRGGYHVDDGREHARRRGSNHDDHDDSVNVGQ